MESSRGCMPALKGPPRNVACQELVLVGKVPKILKFRDFVLCWCGSLLFLLRRNRREDAGRAMLLILLD